MSRDSELKWAPVFEGVLWFLQRPNTKPKAQVYRTSALKGWFFMIYGDLQGAAGPYKTAEEAMRICDLCIRRDVEDAR